MISRLIGEDISMRLIEAPDLGNVKADIGQIEQVVVNLSVNARDAMPGGGTITMATRNATVAGTADRPANVPPGEYILLEVSDTGTGMSPEIQARIFEPFFTTKAQGHGTGLGLATCYGIVKQSGGEIAVQSKIGVGTTFQIYLPRVYEECTPMAPPCVAGLLPTGSQTILVVEDEMPVRGIIRSILQRLKYTVLEASNGAEAIQLLDTPAGQSVDLLMSDIVMPEMGGKELVQRLVGARPELRVIMISGYPITPQEELPPGTHFLAKPFTPKALAEAVHEAFAPRAA
jgi:CheY-like chemotaxis protein